MTSSDFDKTAPANAQNTQDDKPASAQADMMDTLGIEDEEALLAYQRRNSRILWGILGVLLLIAAAVFLVLPDYVSPPRISTEQIVAPDSSPASGGGNASTPQISPFEEAQLMRQRDAAQETLGRLLELQEQLEGKAVEQWAQERYDEALALAEQGDAAYREQQFSEAGRHYQQGLEVLETLEAEIPAVVEDLLEEGTQAIRSGDAARAEAAYELAMVLAPDSVEADEGLQRAQVLDEVLELNAAAESAREGGDLESARELYQEALALDGEHQPSREALASVETAIVERNFSRLMSQGYAALQADEAEAAEDFFEEALTVKPGSDEANTALEQSRDQITSEAISRHLRAAEAHEADEEWEAALRDYESALEVDPNVVAAVEGRNRARSRLNLDNFLKSLLEDPLTLGDSSVYQQSLEVYSNALRVPDAGPRLREQLRQTKFYLEQARLPRTVTFNSDGMTTVTLLRVERLGQFSSTNVQLTPGRYVATGMRQGYRDVRREFTVPFEEAPPVVEVICDQSIR